LYLGTLHCLPLSFLVHALQIEKGVLYYAKNGRKRKQSDLASSSEDDEEAGPSTAEKQLKWRRVVCDEQERLDIMKSIHNSAQGEIKQL
jgi:hypothetical protein